MEEKEITLVKRHLGDNPELKRLWEEHLGFERQLGQLESRQPKTDELHFEIERIKKLKLKGKDFIARILIQYR
jgi:uncharacterized protein YdcH (DUF465 family)